MDSQTDRLADDQTDIQTNGYMVENRMSPDLDGDGDGETLLIQNQQMTDNKHELKGAMNIII